MVKYLFATEKEKGLFDKFKERCPSGEEFVVGRGAKNMPVLTEHDTVINLGYASGYQIPLGRVVEVSFVVQATTNKIIRIDRAFNVESRICKTVPNFTKDEFFKSDAIYDEELFEIARQNHKDIYCLKITSEDLDGGDNTELQWMIACKQLEDYFAERGRT